MNERIAKNGKVNINQIPVIPLEHTMIHNKKDVKYIAYTCHNRPGDSNSSKYVIKVLVYDFGHPEEWINFVKLINKCLVGQNITTGPAMYAVVQRVLEGDAKAQFNLQTAAHRNQTVINFKNVMATMTAHVMLYATRKGI